MPDLTASTSARAAKLHRPADPSRDHEGPLVPGFSRRVARYYYYYYYYY